MSISIFVGGLQVTDLEAFQGLLERFGIGSEEVEITWADRRSLHMDNPKALEAAEAVQIGCGMGLGSYARFFFDASGKFIDYGIWE